MRSTTAINYELNGRNVHRVHVIVNMKKSEPVELYSRTKMRKNAEARREELQ